MLSILREAKSPISFPITAFCHLTYCICWSVNHKHGLWKRWYCFPLPAGWLQRESWPEHTVQILQRKQAIYLWVLQLSSKRGPHLHHCILALELVFLSCMYRHCLTNHVLSDSHAFFLCSSFLLPFTLYLALAPLWRLACALRRPVYFQVNYPLCHNCFRYTCNPLFWSIRLKIRAFLDPCILKTNEIAWQTEFSLLFWSIS